MNQKCKTRTLLGRWAETFRSLYLLGRDDLIKQILFVLVDPISDLAARNTQDKSLAVDCNCKDHVSIKLEFRLNQPTAMMEPNKLVATRRLDQLSNNFRINNSITLDKLQNLTDEMTRTRCAICTINFLFRVCLIGIIISLTNELLNGYYSRRMGRSKQNSFVCDSFFWLEVSVWLTWQEIKANNKVIAIRHATIKFRTSLKCLRWLWRLWYRCWKTTILNESFCAAINRYSKSKMVKINQQIHKINQNSSSRLKWFKCGQVLS